MSSSSEFGLTENEIIYELASILHSGILDILAYGIYTAIFFVALYLTRECLISTSFSYPDWVNKSVSANR